MRLPLFLTEKRRLRREVIGLRKALSACAKRQNRYVERCKTLDAACAKHHAQAQHDQTYIDHLEAQLTEATIHGIRQEMRA